VPPGKTVYTPCSTGGGILADLTIMRLRPRSLPGRDRRRMGMRDKSCSPTRSGRRFGQLFDATNCGRDRLWGPRARDLLSS